MASMNVKATRMELLHIKKRIKIARRGHKLLKDKRDELMREFLALIRRNATLRSEAEEMLASAYVKMALARAAMGERAAGAALLTPPEVSLSVGERNLSSVMVPEFQVVSWDRNRYDYGLASTSPMLDEAVADFNRAMSKLLDLSASERSIELMAREIEKTRRRVNALEHVLLPQLEEAMKSIRMKLDELERSKFSNLMRIKSIMT